MNTTLDLRGTDVTFQSEPQRPPVRAGVLPLNVEESIMAGVLVTINSQDFLERDLPSLWTMKEWYKEYFEVHKEDLKASERLRQSVEEGLRRVERRIAQLVMDSDLPSGYDTKDPKGRNNSFGGGPLVGTKRGYFEGATAMQEAYLFAYTDDNVWDEALTACKAAGWMTRRSVFEQLKKMGVVAKGHRGGGRKRSGIGVIEQAHTRSSYHAKKHHIDSNSVLQKTAMQVAALAENVSVVEWDDIDPDIARAAEPELQTALKLLRQLHINTRKAMKDE